MSFGHVEGCSRIGPTTPHGGLTITGRIAPMEQRRTASVNPPAEGQILIISGVEILCQRDLILGPLIAHEFRIGVNREGRAVVDAKCPVCGDISQVEFFT
jgi:hypothetical protein